MAARVEPLIKMLHSLSLVRNADCPSVRDSTALLELFFTTKPHPYKENVLSREISGETQRLLQPKLCVSTSLC